MGANKPYLKREAAMKGHAKQVVAMAEALEEIKRTFRYWSKQTSCAWEGWWVESAREFETASSIEGESISYEELERGRLENEVDKRLEAGWDDDMDWCWRVQDAHPRGHWWENTFRFLTNH